MKTHRITRTRIGMLLPRLVLVAVLVSLLFSPKMGRALSLVSSGMLTPETISLAPDEFGDWGGQYYFIPDPGRTSGQPQNSKIWAMPIVGGQAVEFKGGAELTVSTIGGLFLPAEGWGDYSGKYLAVGWNSDSVSRILTFDSNGAMTELVVSDWNEKATFTTPVLVPVGFGGYGGQLLVTDQRNGALRLIDSDGEMTTLATGIGFAPFGGAFAPDEFGSVGGRLLVSQAGGGSSTTEKEIRAYNSDGSSDRFATIPLLPGQVSLRQLGFAPKGFFSDYPDEYLLLVSVAGSTFGGGTYGDLLVLDGNGEIVKSLRILGTYDKFDPRGFLFTDDGLLVSDASDPILLAQPQDFVPGRNANVVPEPATVVLLGSGLIGLATAARRKRNQ